MRLRVKIRNSKECRTELNFPDLAVKYNNGYSVSLRVAEGEEIPLDVLDPEDVRKSLKVGSLKGYSDNGWVEEITSETPKTSEQTTRLSHFITEKMILAPEMIAPLTPLPDASTPKEVPPPTNLPEEPVDLDKPKISIAPIELITDLTLVKTYEDFERLSQFLKLRFIKDSTDVVLLKDILGKTSSIRMSYGISHTTIWSTTCT